MRKSPTFAILPPAFQHSHGEPVSSRRVFGKAPPGCSVTWLARLHGVQKVAGSNPVTPTCPKYKPNQELNYLPSFGSVALCTWSNIAAAAKWRVWHIWLKAGVSGKRVVRLSAETLRRFAVPNDGCRTGEHAAGASRILSGSPVDHQLSGSREENSISRTANPHTRPWASRGGECPGGPLVS